MNDSPLDRRQFHRLTSAALGGMLAGTLVGCRDRVAPPRDEDTADAELHLCRGLNECKGQGRGGDNACAGQGACATIAHQCAGHNDCKNQGGCGATPGLNECSGKGGCQVPMHAGAWETARARFEEQMRAADKSFGAAPPRPDEG